MVGSVRQACKAKVTAVNEAEAIELLICATAISESRAKPLVGRRRE